MKKKIFWAWTKNFGCPAPSKNIQEIHSAIAQGKKYKKKFVNSLFTTFLHCRFSVDTVLIEMRTYTMGEIEIF